MADLDQLQTQVDELDYLMGVHQHNNIDGTKALPVDSSPLMAATDGATTTFNIALTNLWWVTLGGNRTLAVSGVTENTPVFVIGLKQDGSPPRTVTWFAGITWTDQTTPTLTTTANRTDWFGFIRTGTDTYHGFIVGQNL